MALVSRNWRDDDWLWPEHNSIWRDRFARDWDDWPMDWPRPRDLIDRFRRDTDRWWRDWPLDWPRMDAIVPRFSSHLDRFDRNWRQDPFWRDLYPRWAEPIFKEGIDVKTNIVNDRAHFAVDIDTYQFRPEELQVKTLDDTLLIEGRHEEVRDADNYTKMYFVRKYQLPPDVMPEDITSSIDSRGRLTVEAQKHAPAIEGHERTIPIESSSAGRTTTAAVNNSSNMLRPGSRSSSYSPRDRHDSGRGSDGSTYLHAAAATPLPPPRTESRNTLDPNYNNYRSEFSKRETDTNGMRHETRREEFREQFRRTGSHSSLIPPATEFPRNDSRLSTSGFGGGSTTTSHQYRAHSSSRNGFRSETPYTSASSDHFLRPSDELGVQRNVRISKTYN